MFQSIMENLWFMEVFQFMVCSKKIHEIRSQLIWNLEITSSFSTLRFLKSLGADGVKPAVKKLLFAYSDMSESNIDVLMRTMNWKPLKYVYFDEPVTSYPISYYKMLRESLTMNLKCLDFDTNELQILKDNEIELDFGNLTELNLSGEDTMMPFDMSSLKTLSIVTSVLNKDHVQNIPNLEHLKDVSIEVDKDDDEIMHMMNKLGDKITSLHITILNVTNLILPKLTRLKTLYTYELNTLLPSSVTSISLFDNCSYEKLEYLDKLTEVDLKRMDDLNGIFLSKINSFSGNSEFFIKKTDMKYENPKIQSISTDNKINMSHFRSGIFRNLTDLSMSFCMYETSKYDKIFDIFKNCPHLEILDLLVSEKKWKCPHIHVTDDGTKIPFPSLRILKISNYNYEGKELEDIFGLVFKTYTFPNLKNVEINSFTFEFLNDNLPFLDIFYLIADQIDDIKCRYSISKLNNVKHIEIHSMLGIPYNYLDPFASYCPNLRSLIINSIINDTDVLINLLERCKYLSYVEATIRFNKRNKRKLENYIRESGRLVDIINYKI